MLSGSSRCRTTSRLAVAAVVCAVAATHPLRADEVEISLGSGRVTLIATDALLTDVLDAWSHAGQTRFVGADRLDNQPVTLHLIDVEEAAALRLLLRSLPGYIAAPRPMPVPEASTYDRVLLLPVRQPLGLESAPTAGASGALADLPGSDASPAPLSPEDLQRLLDAVSGRQPPAGLPEVGTGDASHWRGVPGHRRTAPRYDRRTDGVIAGSVNLRQRRSCCQRGLRDLPGRFVGHRVERRARAVRSPRSGEGPERHRRRASSFSATSPVPDRP